MEVVSVAGKTRELARKKGAKAVRREGRIPCVLYGGDEILHFSVEALSLRDIIYTPAFRLVELDLDGKKIKCILKEAQFHPVTDSIVHVDFLRLEEGRKIKVQVPVKFEGSAPGLKSGGKLIQKLRRVNIMATPENLVNELELDVSELELGQSIRVRDIKAYEGVEVMNNPSIPIASIEIPRALKSAASAAEGLEGEAAAEGEEVAEGEAEGEG